MRSRDVLNRYMWDPAFDFQDVVVEYIHRGAPGDTGILHGRDIKHLGRQFMETEGASIPYHRIIRILYRGEVVWQRG